MRAESATKNVERTSVQYVRTYVCALQITGVAKRCSRGLSAPLRAAAGALLLHRCSPVVTPNPHNKN